VASAVPTSIFVAAYDAAGACAWTWAFDNDSSLLPEIFLLPSGDLIVVGTAFDQNTQLTHVSTAGTVMWTKELGIGGAVATMVPSGDVVLAAEFTGTIDLGNGPLVAAGADMAIVRVDAATGDSAWSRRLGSTGAEVDPFHVEADATGGLLFNGLITGSADLGGGPTPGSGSSFALRLDGTGAFRWQQTGAYVNVKTDPCGGAITQTICHGCASGADTYTVQRIAP
jgi:hypothetical protein